MQRAEDRTEPDSLELYTSPALSSELHTYSYTSAVVQKIRHQMASIYFCFGQLLGFKIWHQKCLKWWEQVWETLSNVSSSHFLCVKILRQFVVNLRTWGLSQKVSLTVSCKSRWILWINHNSNYLQEITGAKDPVQQGAGSVLKVPESRCSLFTIKNCPCNITTTCKAYFLKQNRTGYHAFKF